MYRLSRLFVHAAPAALLAMSPLCALAQTADDSGDHKAPVENIVVEGRRAASTGATGLNLTPIETPQSVTIVDRQQIVDFNLRTANDLLDQVPGVNVERTETERTVYDARGFDITNFEIDGTGLPLISGIQFGELDTAIFDRVEIIRGADSMLTGTGNPSATVNYVRKRPTKDFMLSATAEYGSWNDGRFEGDISGPLNQEGTLRGRFVYAYEDQESYLDYYRRNRNVFYGVADWDVTPNLTLTAGYSIQDSRAKGNMWGTLPLTFSDGTLIDYPVSASTAAPWTYWNIRDESAFGEALYRLDNGWSAKGMFTYKGFTEHAKLLYAGGYPDPVTGLGVPVYSGIYPSFYDQYMLDVSATGPFILFGREHQLVVGFNGSRNREREFENFSNDTIEYPSVFDWGHAYVAEPSYPGAYLATDITDRLYRFYASTHLNITDRLKGIVGFNIVNLTSTGFSYTVDEARQETAASPYAGAMYDLTPNIAAYASYTDIYNPQSDVDITHHRLPSAHGESIEGGFKTQWLDKRLDITAAGFHGEQANLAQFAGYFKDGKSYSAGVHTFVTGYEFEITGRLTDDWTIEGGWTQLSIEDGQGNPTRTFTPPETLKLSTVYTIPSLSDLKLGAALRWQNETTMPDTYALLRQPAYAVLDLMAGVQVMEGLRATLNVRNVADEKYLNSLEWNQAYYAAPRSVAFSLEYRI
ncbi:MAG TPA: TonB-dependent siderophore receptor [Alphaproteobacteria bacterium]|nr:TonB-dependent siderophore receptor [Alphaproteobacteria bacterium]